MPKRHLHRTYHAAHCGRDASHIAMTYDSAEATCDACLAAAAKAKENSE